ncbi:MAG: hypothetical protein ACI97B_001899, partial [Verrucomicrobiales bacterium]
GSVRPPAKEQFCHSAIRQRFQDIPFDFHWGQGSHFFDAGAAWNQAGKTPVEEPQ